MAYIRYDKLCRSEFYNNVSAKDKVKEVNFNHLKLKVNDTYKKVNKITTNSEPSNDEDVENKAHLDEQLSKIEGEISYIEEHCKENKLHNNKHSEEFLIENAVQTTVQILSDMGLFDNFDNAEEILKDYLLFKVNKRRRPDYKSNKWWW